MANYSIVVDTSNFKPFDLNAPLSVLRDYRDAYYRYEDALNKIAEENGMYQLPIPDGDNAQQQAIYDQYAKYNNDFKEISADFAKGMNWRNAQLVRDINRRYGLEAKPIKQAVENYNKFMENKNNIRANKDARFGKDPSIYDFVGGKVPQLQVKDAKDIQTGAAAIMKGLSSIIKDDPKVRQSIMEGYDLYMSGGLNQDNAKALVQALNDYNERTNYKHNSAVQNYMDALNRYYDSLGVQDWDESEKRKVWNDVVVGAMSAMPEREEKLYEKLDLKRAGEKASIAATYENIAASKQDRYHKAQLFPYQRTALMLENQGKALGNQKSALELKYAREDRPYTVKARNLNYDISKLEHDEKLYDFNQKKERVQNIDLYNKVGGKRWYFGDPRNSRVTEGQRMILNHKNPNYDVVVGNDSFRFTGTRGKWVRQDGQIFTEQQLVGLIGVADGKSKKAEYKYNDYVRAGRTKMIGKNGKSYVETDIPGTVMGIDNNFYSTAILNQAPSKSSSQNRKRYTAPGAKDPITADFGNKQVTLYNLPTKKTTGSGIDKKEVSVDNYKIAIEDSDGTVRVHDIGSITPDQYQSLSVDVHNLAEKIKRGDKQYTDKEQRLLTLLGIYYKLPGDDISYDIDGSSVR